MSRTVVVTGAAGRVGTAIAERFARSGHRALHDVEGRRRDDGPQRRDRTRPRRPGERGEPGSTHTPPVRYFMYVSNQSSIWLGSFWK
jgi:NAD(P)-dependent dehydrogenase (short-subunit alcohol dehydrogenase family)